jgi:ketosteroid isomerase-like protein
MSQENVETIRQAFAAFDSEGFDGLAEFWHPDINWRAMEGAPDDVGVFTGHDAMRRYLDDWLEMFDDSRIEVEEFIDAGDRVVVMQHGSGKSKRTGIPVDMRYAVVYTVQDGKIVRGREYATRDEALKAVGLEE